MDLIKGRVSPHNRFIFDLIWFLSQHHENLSCRTIQIKFESSNSRFSYHSKEFNDCEVSVSFEFVDVASVSLDNLGYFGCEDAILLA